MNDSNCSGHLFSGNPIIDFQHRLALQMLKKLTVAMKSGRLEDTLPEALIFFECYCIEHFGDEEKILRRHKYPCLEVHIKEHEYMTGEVRKFKIRLADEGYSSSLAIESLAFLSAWLKQHFEKADRRIIEYLRKFASEKAMSIMQAKPQ